MTCIVVFFMIIIGAAGFQMYYTKNILIKDDIIKHDITKDDITKEDIHNGMNPKDNIKVQKNIAVFGVDKGASRTDAIFIVTVNMISNQVKILAIPRDTKVEWSEYQTNKVEETYKVRYTYSKITDMSSLGGKENLREFTISTLENILDIKIDNYLVIDTDIFVEVVDAMGGIEVNVPRKMKYSDTKQGLYIDLEPGSQRLDGKQAEGLVRWRHNNSYSEQYAQGDLGRIETQQLFIKAFTENLKNENPYKIIKIITVVFSKIKTDTTLEDSISYLSYIKDFSISNLTFYKLPGNPVREELDYYIINQEELSKLKEELFSNLNLI